MRREKDAIAQLSVIIVYFLCTGRVGGEKKSNSTPPPPPPWPPTTIKTVTPTRGSQTSFCARHEKQPVVSAVRCGAVRCGAIIDLLTSEIRSTNPTPILSRVIGRPSRYGSLSTPSEASSSPAAVTQPNAPKSQFPIVRFAWRDKGRRAPGGIPLQTVRDFELTHTHRHTD
ncbi:hypothetical protein CGRA01v4_06523 [Colletotrichum graminicola]|nr:hypothetical protein CGRA01v4_06523 [Colletotrichum graminicola]